jgi:peroxiredoxin
VRETLVLTVFFLGAALALASGPRPAPPFEAKTLDGATFSLSRHRGQVVLINYWATSCGPCLSEMPALDRFYRAHHAEGLEMLGIDADAPEQRGRALLRAKEVAYAIAWSSEVKDQGYHQGCSAKDLINAGATSCQYALPYTFLIDRSGEIVYEGARALDDASLEALVTPLLGAHAGH